MVPTNISMMLIFRRGLVFYYISKYYYTKLETIFYEFLQSQKWMRPCDGHKQHMDFFLLNNSLSSAARNNKDGNWYHLDP